MKLFAITLALIFILDRLTKWLALTFLPFQHPVDVIKNVFSFTFIYNQGAAFGILQQQKLLLSTIGILVFVMVIWLRRELLQTTLSKIGFGFLLGGDLGNLYDRLFLHGVVDMFDFHFWPIFNIADMSINIGIAILIVEFLFFQKNKSV